MLTLERIGIRSPTPSYEAWVISYNYGVSRPCRSIRCFGIKVWEQRQYEKPRIISVWRNSSLKDSELEQIFFRKVRDHADSRWRGPKTIIDAYDLKMYHMSIYRKFRRLDCDVQQLINLLLRGRLLEGNGQDGVQQWELVSLREVPGGGATSSIREPRRPGRPWWGWGKECSMSEYRVILRDVRA